jgi:hypothetical protein
MAAIGHERLACACNDRKKMTQAKACGYQTAPVVAGP